jgi:hypothetical protein
VTSLAYNPASRTLFYTADNTAYRDLMALDTTTRQQRMLLKDARIGDLSFNRSDRSLWGIRTFNGICTLVRIPEPYTSWNAIYSWPYGETVYDLDVAPVAIWCQRQLARSTAVRACGHEDGVPPVGRCHPDKQFDFGTAIPSNFVFSLDGKYICLAARTTPGSPTSSAMSWRPARSRRSPMPRPGSSARCRLDNGSLLVFRYTGDGFVPSIIDAKPVKDVNPITFLGSQVVEKHPILKQWAAGSPGVGAASSR